MWSIELNCFIFCLCTSVYVQSIVHLWEQVALRKLSSFYPGTYVWGVDNSMAMLRDQISVD